MSGKVLVLRTNPADGTSHGGFVWPESGPVEAPDWNDRPECGGGLHGLLWGCGDARLLHAPNDEATVWRVVEVDADSVVDLGGKVKFPRGIVVFCGDRNGALAYLDGHGAADKPVVYATRTAGDRGIATAGYRGIATAGYGGIATAGYGGTATAGYGGIVQIKAWDTRAARFRIVTGYIGEDGLLPNVHYRLDDDGNFVRVDQ